MCGIIPTRVGTRKKFILNFGKIQDHPHACGDKKKCCETSYSYKGSSPRVWGQGTYKVSKCTLSRIIPTRVGTRPVFYQFV